MTLLCVLLLVTIGKADGQYVNLPLGHWSYRFLDRMQAKGVLREANLMNKPLSRSDVAVMVAGISEGELSEVDLERLKWLREELAHELERFSAQKERRHAVILKYPDAYFVLNPAVGYKKHTSGGIEQANNERSVSTAAVGLYSYGYLYEQFGYSLYFSNSRERGNSLRLPSSANNDSYVRRLIPERGLASQRKFTGGDDPQFFFDKSEAYLTFQHKGFRIEYGSEVNRWGPGYRGTLTLSDKPPPLATLKARLDLHNRLEFIFLTSALRAKGRVDDPIYEQIYGEFRSRRPSKYFTGHILTLNLPGASFSLSESVVYGLRLEPLYFIPILPIWSSQTDLGDLDNVQVTFSADIHAMEDMKIYGQLHVDEIEFSSLFSSENRNWIGYQMGVLITDALSRVPDLDLRGEYTRVDPRAYRQRFPINDLESHGYPLGFWTGPNADNLYLSAEYFLSRALSLTTWFERTRKGELRPIDDQYKNETIIFLDPELKSERRRIFSIGGSYEPFRDFFIELSFQQISNETRDKVNTSENTKTNIFFGARYNIY
ncbi:MAG: hypothetical protein IIC39_01650 [Candidatus Marinimicrobia bacterium]|nr:hypothetical protein [Candidatus Neomarinimicrobiota bacterium]